MPKQSKGPSHQQQATAVRVAQQLLGDGEADRIIGDQPAEHKLLMAGAQAEMGLIYRVMRTYGLRRGKSEKMFAQGMVVMIDLLHRAYALGIRRGRMEARGTTNDGGN